MYIENAVSLLISVLVLAVYLVVVHILVKEAVNRGYPEERKGVLWAIGLFLTPVILAIYVLFKLPTK